MPPFIVLLMLALILALHQPVQLLLQVDSCLDRGGVWDDGESTCVGAGSEWERPAQPLRSGLD
jgi:hypothetical protein